MARYHEMQGGYYGNPPPEEDHMLYELECDEEAPYIVDEESCDEECEYCRMLYEQQMLQSGGVPEVPTYVPPPQPEERHEPAIVPSKEQTETPHPLPVIKERGRGRPALNKAHKVEGEDPLLKKPQPNPTPRPK